MISNDKEMIMEKFKHLTLFEFTNLGSTIDEVGEDEMYGGGPMGGGAPMDGGAPMGGGAPMDGGAPMGGGQQGPEGFAPQGVEPDMGLDTIGGEGMGETPNESEDEEVIDVDDLTDSQENTEKKIDKLTDKFGDLMKALSSIEKRLDKVDNDTERFLSNIKSEIEKRNPTPMQRLSMRSTKSSPYGMTPDEYMNNYAPENYSAEDDNNGADDPQYKITKGDIDNISDYNAIAREFDGLTSLKDILDF